MADTDSTQRVQQILEQASEELQSIAVPNDDQLEYDLGNLMVTSTSTLDEALTRDPNKIDDYLCSLARDSVQALLNRVWELPSERIDSDIYVTLPKPTTRLPREKPVPKARPPTRWEKYASEKGLQKRKKDKKVWDETLKRWVPRYGYRKIEAEKEKNWVKEVPATANPYEDQFAKAAEMKKENVAKNEFQRLRNIAKSRKLKVPNVGITGNEYASTKELSLAMHHAKHATASLGKFQPDLPNEKKVKGLGKKRKMEFTTGSGQMEKKRNMEVLEKIDKPGLNLDGAVHKQIRDENVAMDLKRKGGKQNPRRSKMGGRHRTKSDQKAIKQGKGFQGKGKGKGKSMGMGNGKGKGNPKAAFGKKTSKPNMQAKGRGGGKGAGKGAGKGKMKGKGKG